MLYHATPYCLGKPLVLTYKKGILQNNIKSVPRKISYTKTVYVHGVVVNKLFLAEEILDGTFCHRAQHVKTFLGSNGFYTFNHPAWKGLFLADSATIKSSVLKKMLTLAKKLLPSTAGLIVRRDMPCKRAYLWRVANEGLREFDSRYEKAVGRRL